jgi:hypothetical protein
VASHDPLRPLVNRLINKLPKLPSERDMDDESQIPATITKPYLVSLHARVKRAFKLRDRQAARYQFLLNKAFLQQDILKAKDNPEKRFDSLFYPISSGPMKEFKLRFCKFACLFIEKIGIGLYGCGPF